MDSFRRRVFLKLGILWLAAGAAALAETDRVHVTSPDGQLELHLFIVTPADSRLVRLAYAVTYRWKLLLDTSLLGIAIRDQEPFLGETVGLVSADPKSVDESYTIAGSNPRRVRNHYNSLIAQYIQNGSLGRRVTIEARAYDDGVAFRYYIPRTIPVEDLFIEEELTDFRFAQNGTVYGIRADGYRAGGDEYKKSDLAAIPRTSLFTRPLLIEQPGVGWAAITEAQVDNYPGMYLFHPDGTTIRTTLAPRLDDASIVMSGTTPAETPWRVIQVASDARNLAASDILLNLNPASAVADTSWIKPPKEFVTITDSADLEAQFAKLEKSGITGVKLDLMHRADQQMIDLCRRAAKSAAEHHLMIEFLNGPTPDGIERTWPNVVVPEDTPFRRLLRGL